MESVEETSCNNMMPPTYKKVYLSKVFDPLENVFTLLDMKQFYMDKSMKIKS